VTAEVGWHIHPGNFSTAVHDDDGETVAWFFHAEEAENYLKLRSMDNLQTLLYQRNFPADEKSREWLDARDAEQATYDLAEHRIAKEQWERG
jgi:hypothetical protein